MARAGFRQYRSHLIQTPVFHKVGNVTTRIGDLLQLNADVPIHARIFAERKATWPFTS